MPLNYCKILSIVVYLLLGKNLRRKNMKITDVKIRQVQTDKSKLKAVATITIDNCFVIHDIKIIEGTSGPFIAMPSRKTAEGDYRDIAHPINSETRNMLIKEILKLYSAVK